MAEEAPATTTINISESYEKPIPDLERQTDSTEDEADDEAMPTETVLHPVDPLRPPDYVPLSTSSEDIPKQVPSTEKMLAKPTVMTGKDNIREVLISGVAFSMVFTGYFIVTSFQTSVNASLGAIALAALFGSFGISSLLAPSVIKPFSEKITLFIGCLMHVLYLFASIKVKSYFLIPASILCGVGGAVVWTASGTLVRRNSSDKTLGRNNGIFWTLYISSIMIGNIFASVFLIIWNNTTVLFLIASIISTVGCFILLFLSVPPSEYDTMSMKQKWKFALRVRAVWETAKLFGQLRMLLFIPFIVYTGALGPLIFGKYPLSIPTKAVGFVIAAYGASDMIGGFLFGRVSDRIGRVPVLVMGVFFGMVGIATASFGNADRLWPRVLGMLLLGLCDACNQTQITAILPILQPKRTGAAYGWRTVVSASIAAGMYFASRKIMLEVQETVSIVAAVCGIISVMCLDRFVWRLTPPKNMKPVKAVPAAQFAHGPSKIEMLPKMSASLQASVSPKPTENVSSVA